MNIGQLIEILRHFDNDLPVYYGDELSEDGWQPVEKVSYITPLGGSMQEPNISGGVNLR